MSEINLVKKNIDSPLVTVLMPVYNGEKYLKEAIKSILDQSYANFELLIINDGSKDSSKEIILSSADSRIKYIENEKNLGLSATLNKGIKIASGKYIARMDCDDISVKERLEKQVKFLNENQNVGIVGAWFKVIEKDIVYKYPPSNIEIRTQLLSNSVLCHPVVMMRKESLLQYDLLYDVAYKYSQDYDLWVRAQQYFELSNLQEILLLYRDHPNQMKQTSGNNVVDEPNRTRIYQIIKFASTDATPEEILLHEQVLRGTYRYTEKSFELFTSWLIKLQRLNSLSQHFEVALFNQYLFTSWFRALITTSKYNIQMFIFIFRLPFFNSMSISQRVKFFLKCLLKRTNYKTDLINI